jgi:hypothetical protein
MRLTSNYRKMLSEIDSLINSSDLKFDYSQRRAVSSALFDVANEHGKGINALFESDLDASGFALLRAHFETFVRATWILNCAEDREIEVFANKDKLVANDKRKLEFGTLLAEVESSLNWSVKLSKIKENSWKALNSYTHGGLFQAAKRFNGSTIELQKDDDTVNECIRFSALLTFLGFCQIIQIAEINELDNDLENLYSRVSEWLF